MLPRPRPAREGAAPSLPYVYLTRDDEKSYEYSRPYALGSLGCSPGGSTLLGAPLLPSGSIDAAGKNEPQTGQQNAGHGTNAAGGEQDAAQVLVPRKRWRALGLELTVSDEPVFPSSGEVPWLASLAHLRSPWLRLHQEIVELSRYLTPSPEEVRARCDAVQRVRQLVCSICPGAQVSVFGSTVTGLYLPASDIDLVITGVGSSSDQRVLSNLERELRRSGWARSVNFISSARVPIVKFEDTETNYPIDVSCNVGGGLTTANKVRELLQLYPPLRPMSMFLKIFLKQRGLSEVYTGGVGSYCLFVMVAAFLKSHPSRLGLDKVLPAGKKKTREGVVPPSSALPLETNVGVLLVDFLRLYGWDLNSSYTNVTHTGPKAFVPLSDSCIEWGLMKDEDSFHVVDPCNGANDLGRSTRDVRAIVRAFRAAHTTLLAPSLPGESLLGRILRLDPALFVRQPKPWGEFNPGETAGRIVADKGGQPFDESHGGEGKEIEPQEKKRKRNARYGAPAKKENRETDSEMELPPAKQAKGKSGSRPSSSGMEAGQSESATKGVLSSDKPSKRARRSGEADAGPALAPATTSALSFEEHMKTAWEKMGSAPKRLKQSRAKKQS